MQRLRKFIKGALVLVVVAWVIVLAFTILIRPTATVVHRGEMPIVQRQAPFGFHTMAKRALCMSGGGYRAALFDVGALWRLNELGASKGIDFVSSVSGGSIVGAYLVLHWPDLQFDPQSGVATRRKVETWRSTKSERLCAQPGNTFEKANCQLWRRRCWNLV